MMQVPSAEYDYGDVDVHMRDTNNLMKGKLMKNFSIPHTGTGLPEFVIILYISLLCFCCGSSLYLG